MDFNIGNLVGAIGGAIGALASEVVANIAVAGEVIAAQADIASILEDGKIDEDEEERLLEDIYKLLVGALIVKFGCESLESSAEDKIDDGPGIFERGYNKGIADAKNVYNCVSDAIGRGYNKGIFDAKNAYNYLSYKAKELAEELYNKHIMPSVGYAGSVSAGARKEAGAALIVDPEGFDADIVATTGTGNAEGKPSIGGAWYASIIIADNGISDTYQDGKNTGWTIGPVSVDIGTADHATSYSISIGPKGTRVYEAHSSDTYTYSSKEKLKEEYNKVAEFGKGYIKYEMDKDKPECQKDKDKTDKEKEMENAGYKAIDNLLGK